MNVALWIAQWGLAAFCVFFAVFRLVDAFAVYRRPAVRSDEPLFTRGESFSIGVVYLASAVGLVSPVLPVTELHHRWVVPAAAIVQVLLMIVLLLLFRYHGSWVIAALLLAVAVLRGWPFAFHS